MENKFLEVVSWEYRRLQGEVESCYRNTFHIITWGSSFMLTAIGLVARYFPEFLLLLLVVPPIFEGLYLGELVRINRAGTFLRFIEEKVNHYLYATATQWQTVCDSMQQDIARYEQNLKAQNFGYDFRKPLYWEQWLSTMRAKGVSVGHVNWPYIIQTGVFPGIFFLILYVWVCVTHQEAYWYGIISGVFVIAIILLLRLAKFLQLKS